MVVEDREAEGLADPKHLGHVVAGLLHGLQLAHALGGLRAGVLCAGGGDLDLVAEMEDGVLDLTLDVDLHLVEAGQALEQVAGHEQAEALVLALQGGEQLVRHDLAPLDLVGVVHPLPAHLPALVHVLVELAEEVVTLGDEGVRHVEGVDLIVDEGLEYHPEVSSVGRRMFRFYQRPAPRVARYPI